MSLTSADGRYVCYDQGDGNFVVYLAATMIPVWDRWSYEAQQSDEWRAGHGGGVHSSPSPSAPVPAPLPAVGSSPLPAGGGRVIQVTDASDGVFVNRGYSYWSQAIVIGDAIYVFAGHASGPPSFFKVDISSGHVDRLGGLVPIDSEGEGWYWTPDAWIVVLKGPRLERRNPFTGEVVVVFDIAAADPQFTDCTLWQSHSSDDGRTHSATVRRTIPGTDGNTAAIGTVVCRDGKLDYFPAVGDLDESAITSDGAYLLIKEKLDGLLTNRIIALATRVTITITNAQGAIGHSDMGPGIAIGEWSPQHGEADGQCVLWDLTKPLTPGNRRTLFQTWNLGHVSVKGGRCLVTDADAIYLVNLAGTGLSGLSRIVNHGMVGDGYDFQTFANLSPCGRVAAYLSNRGSDRLDLFLLLL